MEKPGNILIVDPDPQFLVEWAAILGEEGFQVLTTSKCTQAIHIVQQDKVDLLIIEAEMPDLKAYEAIPILKGMDPTLLIIVTAGQNSPELEAQIRRHPIFYYHVKTFGPEELMLAVRNAWERLANSGQRKGD